MAQIWVPLRCHSGDLASFHILVKNFMRKAQIDRKFIRRPYKECKGFSKPFIYFLGFITRYLEKHFVGFKRKLKQKDKRITQRKQKCALAHVKRVLMPNGVKSVFKRVYPASQWDSISSV